MTKSKQTKKAPTDTAKSDSGKGADKPAQAPASGGLSRRAAYIILILIIGFGILIWRQYLAPVPSPGTATSVGSIGKPKIGGPFTLVDQDGRTVTEADFKGSYMLVYFGYTFCPDVCPTSLSVIADAMDMIGDKAERVTPVFITVDPERDTPEQMKMYVGYFHPKLVGLTGSYNQVADVTQAYKAYYAKAVDGNGSGDEYLMDHSSITYLMSPDGEFIAHFSHGVDADEMAARLKEILK